MPRVRKSSGNAGTARPAALKSVQRALHVLEYIAIHPGRATDIADGLGLSWATLHRTLQQLEQDGFLRKDDASNHYSIGPRMYFVGSTYIANHQVVDIAKPYLEQALKLPGITVQLVERSGFPVRPALFDSFGRGDHQGDLRFPLSAACRFERADSPRPRGSGIHRCVPLARTGATDSPYSDGPPGIARAPVEDSRAGICDHGCRYPVVHVLDGGTRIRSGQQDGGRRVLRGAQVSHGEREQARAVHRGRC